MLSKKKKKRQEKQPEHDKLFTLIVLKMMLSLTLSVALFFASGAVFLYAAFNKIPIEGYPSIVGSFLGINMAILMLYYSISFFKYIVSD